MNGKTSATYSLNISKNFNTTPEHLFDCLSCKEHLEKWFAPTEELTTEVRTLDFRVGGQFEIAMIDRENEKSHVVVGEYLEIARPDRLVFSWRWQSEPEDETSQVSFELSLDDGGTLMKLTHDRFDSQESCDKHAQGWNGCLNRLVAATKTAERS